MEINDKRNLFAKRKPGKYRFLFRFLLKTVLFAAIIYMVLTYVVKITLVSGNRMSPFVRDGDLAIFYRLEDIYLEDVVIYVTDDGKEQIGRITASAGQTVDFAEDGGYTVDGYHPTEEIPYETYQSEKDDVAYPIQLSENEYFILNDFRSITDDSRELGVIRRDQIKGTLLFLMRHRSF